MTDTATEIMEAEARSLLSATRAVTGPIATPIGLVSLALSVLAHEAKLSCVDFDAAVQHARNRVCGASPTEAGHDAETIN